MKQTNYLLFDFLDFDPALKMDEALWKACRPTKIKVQHHDVIITIPFQKQILSVDMVADKKVARIEKKFCIRLYSNQVIRAVFSESGIISDSSEMLDLHPDVQVLPLHIEKETKRWLIQDENRNIKAVVDLGDPEIEHWSDLLPPPDETFDIRFFPEKGKMVKISARDQFFPARNDAMSLAFIERNGKEKCAAISFSASPDEKFVGTGERFSKMDLSGRTFQLKNQDGQGVNNRRAYKNIPFYMSSRGYGLFVHTTAWSKFSLADHSSRSVQVLVEEPMLDFFIIGGRSPEKITYHYRQLTGFPPMLPLWSFGIWMSRMTYFSADEVNTICKRLRDEEYPCDVIHLDTGWFRTDWLCEWKFNPERFPDPKGFVQNLKKQGYRVSLWQMPYIAEKAEQLDEAVANHYIGKLKQSKEQGGSNFSALDYAGTIDFTYPKAVEWYKNLLRELLEMGVVCIKTDFGEEIHLDADYHNMAPELLNNLYALLYQKAAFEVTKQIAGDGIVWARAGWAGCQRFPLHWGGDAACSWDGMAASLKGGLHLGLSGFAFWSHDVPGFHGVPDFMNSVIPNDLYIRWTQFGVFTSHIRYHGTSKREPYEYPEISGMIKKWWNLRYMLIPYIIAQSKLATQSGYPVLRAMIFHHPDDVLCWHMDDQYYFGDDFLVAPVMNSENKRDIYLPDGEWVNLFTGTAEQGGRWLKNKVIPLDEMPVWVKNGAHVPIYPDKVNCTDDMDLHNTSVLVINENFKGITPLIPS